MNFKFFKTTPTILCLTLSAQALANDNMFNVETEMVSLLVNKEPSASFQVSIFEGLSAGLDFTRGGGDYVYTAYAIGASVFYNL